MEEAPSIITLRPSNFPRVPKRTRLSIYRLNSPVCLRWPRIINSNSNYSCRKTWPKLQSTSDNLSKITILAMEAVRRTIQMPPVTSYSSSKVALIRPTITNQWCWSRRIITLAPLHRWKADLIHNLPTRTSLNMGVRWHLNSSSTTWWQGWSQLIQMEGVVPLSNFSRQWSGPIDTINRYKRRNRCIRGQVAIIIARTCW